MTYRDWRWYEGDFRISPRGDVELTEGLEVVQQDLMARLISPRGSHWAFPQEGSRVPEFVGAPADELTRLELVQEAELTCMEDIRVREARGELVGEGPRWALRLRVALEGEALELLVRYA